MLSRLFLILIIFLFPSNTHGLDLVKDEVDFFNVGQGHAVLINKAKGEFAPGVPYSPLLIDAGATAHPYVIGQKYIWEKGNEAYTTNKISRRIVEFWQLSNNGRLQGGRFKLNIIVTHPDRDHLGFLPAVLGELREKAQTSHFTFETSALLGGQSALYPTNFLQSYPVKPIIYSEQYPNLFSPGTLGFLETSGCITHLFCPIGIKSDHNRWSIITRVQLNGLSAILTGDADEKVKSQMLSKLGAPANTLESDILLVPHHGARKTFNTTWDHAVNPQAIIIGAAPNDTYHHPRGETILEFLALNNGKGRIWLERVRPHGIQYYCAQPFHQQIQAQFQQQSARLFDSVPNKVIAENGMQPGEHWQLAWVDLPLYTLWTTGTLYFSGNVKTPVFAEASYGMMSYIAVSQPGYLFPPHMRNKLIPLSQTEQDLCQTIFQRMKKEYEHSEIKLREAENILLREMLLIDEQSDREFYLQLISESFNRKTMLLIDPSTFFLWMREAIVHRNKAVQASLQRIQEATKFVMINMPQEYIGPLKHLYDADVDITLAGGLNHRVFILKTFAVSSHPLEHLGRYIKTYYEMARCGPSDEELHLLCPFGYPEWIQLSRLMAFFRKIIVEPLGESISIMDILDITIPRKLGKNFKEIAKDIIDGEARFQAKEKTNPKGADLTQQLKIMTLDDRQQPIYQEVQARFLEMLNEYFPKNLDPFLS